MYFVFAVLVFELDEYEPGLLLEELEDDEEDDDEELLLDEDEPV